MQNFWERDEIVGVPSTGAPRLVPLGQKAPKEPSPQTPAQAQQDQLSVENTALSIAEKRRDLARPEPATPPEAFNQEGALRKEYGSHEAVKNYASIVPLYASAVRAEPGGAGDMNIIYALAKAMDPGSVVREGELQIASSTGSAGQRLMGLFQKARTGGSLTEDVRKGLLAEFRNRASAAADAYNQVRAQYGSLAQRYQIDPSVIVGEHAGAPYQQAEADFLGRPVRNLDGSQGAAPATATPEAMDAQIKSMIDARAPASEILNYVVGVKGRLDEDDLAILRSYDAALQAGQGVGNVGVRTAPAESTAMGIAQGALKPIDRAAEGLQNLTNSALGTDFSGASDVAQQRQQYFRQNPGTEGGEFIGNVLGVLPTAALGGPVIQGATSGMLLSDSRSAGDLATDAVIGGVGGKIADKAIGAAANVIAPRISPAVRKLSDEGVELTPSQIMGGRAKMIEDRATSLPVAGERVLEGREKALDTFNRAAANRPLRTIGLTLPKSVKSGNEAVKFVGEKLSEGYRTTLAKVSVQLDKTFATRIYAIRMKARLPDKEAAEFDEIIKRELTAAFSGKGSADGRAYKMLDEKLEAMAADFKSAQGEPYKRQLGEAVSDFKDQLAALVRRQNPREAGRLRQLDEGWAQYARLRIAAAKNVKDGRASPAQLGQAVRQADRSVGKGATARGDALMQDLASAGQEVLPSSIGSSGTTERANLTDPVAWVAGLGMAPLFGQKGSEAFRKAVLKPRPLPAEIGANALRRLPAGPIGAIELNALLNPPSR